jgi:hypothetical protein
LVGIGGTLLGLDHDTEVHANSVVGSEGGNVAVEQLD